MDPLATMPLIPSRPPVPARELPLPAFLRAIRTNALTMWTAAAYEQDVVVRRFLGRTNVLLNAPEAIHRVLVDNPENYRRSPASIRILRPIVGNGLLLSEGDAWRHQRRTIAPALAPRVMPMLAHHVVATAQEQIGAIAAQAAQGPIDLLAAMQGLTLEIAGRSMFSLEMRAFGTPLRRLLAEFAERFARPFLFDMLLPPSVPTLRDLRRRRFRARWMRLVETIMHDRLREPQPGAPRDLFDLLRAARDPDTGEAFSPEQLRDQLATLLLAGHETTAVTLFWSLTLLAQDAQEQMRLAEEVRGVAIEPENATAVLPLLARTRAVVSEALRLYPPAFTMAREAIGPDRLGDFCLPRRSVVLIAPWVLHRHRMLWHEPDTFDPSRFMPDAPAVPRFAYLPFGAGPRVCVGAQFALTEAVLVLAMLVQRFRFALEDTRPVLPVAIVTTQPDHPARFRLRAR
ncbi:MAG TPA: cytochrome P450 [Acetobacteraceae bacterium]|nr:cytochrome P450 [Acetobacteraceae bacterium]